MPKKYHSLDQGKVNNENLNLMARIMTVRVEYMELQNFYAKIWYTLVNLYKSTATTAAIKAMAQTFILKELNIGKEWREKAKNRLEQWNEWDIIFVKLEKINDISLVNKCTLKIEVILLVQCFNMYLV